MFDDDDGRLQHYLEIGAVEVAGIDPDGEFIYEICERAQVVAPELWHAHQIHIEQSLTKMFEEGLLDVTYDENLEAHVKLSEEGKKRSKEFGIIEMDKKDLPNN
jgi:hypothetical protein